MSVLAPVQLIRSVCYRLKGKRYEMTRQTVKHQIRLDIKFNSVGWKGIHGHFARFKSPFRSFKFLCLIHLSFHSFCLLLGELLHHLAQKSRSLKNEILRLFGKNLFRDENKNYFYTSKLFLQARWCNSFLDGFFCLLFPLRILWWKTFKG